MRDVEIVRLVRRFHFLSSAHVSALVGGSDQQIRRRLQLLYHHGYLERPRAQLDYFGRAGSQPMVYGLANGGAKLLVEREGISPEKIDWSYKNAKARRVFLDHTLGIADVMVSFELGCRNEKGISLIDQEQVLTEAPAATRASRNPHRFEANVSLNGKREKLALVPDRAFALEFESEAGTERANFFLEYDRGTMPVERRSMRGSSISKKLLTYHAGWQQERHTRQYGWTRFRVLTVTNSKERVAHMVSVSKALNNGRGSRLFLFTEGSQIGRRHIMDIEWTDGRGDLVRLGDA